MTIPTLPFHFLFLFLLNYLFPLFSWSQVTTGILPSPTQVSFRAMPQDSLPRGGLGQPYHCQLKLRLPDSVAVVAIHLEVDKPGNGPKVAQARIPVRGKSPQNRRVRYIRRGNVVWLDLGILRGNPNYTATLRIEDRQGQLSAPVSVGVGQ
ncbi:MAG: hypothetical protein SF052_17045 [Bacteroidia bacterium]|nr:hypothetical protein [Bacteroidia bacterium]